MGHGKPLWPTLPIYFNHFPGDGTRTVYVKFIDSAGNESGAYSDTIILDESIPVISNFTINNNGMGRSRRINAKYRCN